MSSIGIRADSIPQALQYLADRVAEDITDIIREEMRRGIDIAIDEALEQGLEGAGDPTHYVDSFRYADTPNGGQIVNDSPYADAIEYGAKPHVPPVAKLANWAAVKFGLDPAWAMDVAKAVIFAPGGIAERGLPPRHVMQATLAQVEANIRRRIRDYRRLHEQGKSRAAIRLEERYGNTRNSTSTTRRRSIS